MQGQYEAHGAGGSLHLHIILAGDVRDCQALQVCIHAAAQAPTGAADALHSQVQRVDLQPSHARTSVHQSERSMQSTPARSSICRECLHTCPSTYAATDLHSADVEPGAPLCSDARDLVQKVTITVALQNVAQIGPTMDVCVTWHRSRQKEPSAASVHARWKLAQHASRPAPANAACSQARSAAVSGAPSARRTWNLQAQPRDQWCQVRPCHEPVSVQAPQLSSPGWGSGATGAPPRALARAKVQRLQDALEGALLQAAAPVLHKVELAHLRARGQRPQRAHVPRGQRYGQPQAAEGDGAGKLRARQPQRQAVLRGAASGHACGSRRWTTNPSALGMRRTASGNRLESCRSRSAGSRAHVPRGGALQVALARPWVDAR